MFKSQEGYLFILILHSISLPIVARNKENFQKLNFFLILLNYKERDLLYFLNAMQMKIIQAHTSNISILNIDKISHIEQLFQYHERFHCKVQFTLVNRFPPTSMSSDMIHVPIQSQYLQQLGGDSCINWLNFCIEKTFFLHKSYILC